MLQASQSGFNETFEFDPAGNPLEIALEDSRINQPDINLWADQKGLPNIFIPDEDRFPDGGFKYTDGRYTIHGHSLDKDSALKYPGYNSGSGSTVSLQDSNLKGMRADTSGQFIKFKRNENRNACHIPLDGVKPNNLLIKFCLY